MKIVARIYQNVPLTLSHTVQLDEWASHHLIHVLRVQCGDNITLFNGEGGAYQAVITHIGKKGVVVQTLSYSAQEVESPIQIHLAQGIARGEKMDFIIQKAVELGVNQIIPLITERCNVKLDSAREKKRISHWQAVAISACEQSGRNRIPHILLPLSLNAWLEMMKEELAIARRYILVPQLSTPITHTERGKKGPHLDQPIVILIGPEGGFSEQEIKTATTFGFLPLNLGPRILRTETASIACIAILQYCFGDMAES